jgi:MFS family permease
MSAIREITLVGTICMAHFLTQAGLSQSIAPLPLIASTFATPTHDPSPSWYSAAYSLTVGTFILPSGRLGDIFGPKRLLIIGWLWFAVASLGAGLYPRIRGAGDQQGKGDGGETFFCFCRALQGIGPALLMPNGLAILGRSYEEGNRKNMAFALFGASAPVGFVVGSVMSSLLAQKINWCWAYWGLAIACATMALVSIATVPSFPGSVSSAAPQDNVYVSHNRGPLKKVAMWKQLDSPGIILGVSGLVLINVAVNQAALVGWSTPYTYFLLILGITILSIFFFIEFHPSLTSHPLIPLATLSLDTCFVLVCIACGWATFSIWIFYIWEFLERLRTLSPLVAAAQFSPAALSGLLAAVSTGFLLSKTTPQVVMVLSMCAFFTGTTIIATTPVDQIYWAQAFFSIVVMPWGMDMSFPSATILLSSKVGAENQGVAMSLVNTVVNYSISIGLGLAGTVQSRADKDGTQLLKGFRAAWYFAMGLSGTGAVIAVTFWAICTWKARRGASWI